MGKKTYIKSGINYSRLLDVMNMLMCWNWDFSMDTFNGIITIPGHHRYDVINELIEDTMLPEDIVLDLDDNDPDTLILDVITLK